MNTESLTTVANIIGAPAFAVLVCVALFGFSLYKILPRLQDGQKATEAIRKDRARTVSGTSSKNAPRGRPSRR